MNEGLDRAKVMFVDDESYILSSIQRMYRSESFKVVTALGAAEGLKKLKDGPFAVIVSDMRMPDMDGVDFLREVKEKSPDTIRMMLSAQSDFKRVIDAINQDEIYKFVEKPWDKENLRFTLLEGIENYQLRIENRHLLKVTTEQNEKLKELNDTLEQKVLERTREIEEKNEALLKKEKLKSDFIGMISHEFRGPITFMTASLSCLVDEKGQLQKELLPYFEKGVQQLGRLVERVIDMSVEEKVDLEPQREEIALNQLIQKLMEQTILVMKSKRKLELKSELDESLGIFMGDRDRILHAVQCILFNAIRFTPDGGSVIVRTKHDENEIFVEVEDTGIGIAPGEHDKIFEKFYEVKDIQFHSSGEFDFNSNALGLGLSIAKSIVESHKGVIQLKSELKEGSLFIIKLPKKQLD